jgi:predicted transcriptional regulator
MSKSRMPEIRELLRREDDGMTIRSIAEYLGANPMSIRNCIHQMPDAYIDRWEISKATRGQFESVWCVIVPPEHCPKPDRSA